MKLRKRGQILIITGLPEDNEILFFAKRNDISSYCIIYGPIEACFPKKVGDAFELFDAKVAVGDIEKQMTIFDVKHGHKYYQGGGFVETKNGPEITFNTEESGKISHFDSIEFEKIFITT